MKKINKEQIIKEIKHLDPKLGEGEESFKIATILLTGAVVGADVKAIAKFIELPVKEVKKYEKNLRTSGVWKGLETHCDWFNPKTGSIAFWCDVLVAQGYITKIKGE